MALRDITLPKFYEDPFYGATQEKLLPMGTNLMGGNIPEWLRPIGESGSPEFQDLLNLTKRDISTAVWEDAARRGVRGPAATKVIADTTADTATKMRWSDYMRSLEGKQWLFGEGRGITEGVRGAGLDFGGQKNQFNLNQAKLQMDLENMIETQKQAKKARESQMWADIIGGAVGAATGLYGYSTVANALKSTPKLGSAAGGANKILDSGNSVTFGGTKYNLPMNLRDLN